MPSLNQYYFLYTTSPEICNKPSVYEVFAICFGKICGIGARDTALGVLANLHSISHGWALSIRSFSVGIWRCFPEQRLAGWRADFACCVGCHPWERDLPLTAKWVGAYILV